MNWVPKHGEEHFVTYLDHRFMLQGLALYESIRRWLSDATLWVICLDTEAANRISRLPLPGLRALSLDDVETDVLRHAKATRSRVEYIYMLTPFTYEFVAAADPSARRITYVDADVYFFASPESLYAELDRTGKSVLMTEHGFAPEYAELEMNCGRFCVQFLPILWDNKGRAVVHDWQQKCLGSTGADYADRSAVFGDQKHLEDWPDTFPEAVHVSRQYAEMLGPWNADHQQRKHGAEHRPVFYHFHSFHLLPGGWLQYCAGYRITAALPLYDQYVASLRRQQALLAAHGIPPAPPNISRKRYWLLRLLWRQLRGREVLRRW
jgi:hypothetical protein